jgi:hypothetical protein
MNFQIPDTASLILFTFPFTKNHISSHQKKWGGGDVLDKEHYWPLNLETAHNYHFLAYHTTTAFWL